MEKKLIACQDCDTLSEKLPLHERTIALCPRCGATLYKSTYIDLDKLSAIACAALIILIIAACTPILSLNLKGYKTEASLSGMINLFNLQQGDFIIMISVLIIVFILPFLEIITLIYILFALRKNWIPPHFQSCLKFIQIIHPWTMTQVFMLGIIITAIKVSSVAHLSFAPASIAFASLTLLTTILSVFDPRDLWEIAHSIKKNHEKAY